MENHCLLELEGTAEQIIFRNDLNGYTVLSVRKNNESVVAVGNMPWVNVGEVLRLIGRWKPHHNFGMQFSVESFQRFMPSERESIVKYLSSGAIKGIGECTAEKIVKEFGEETLYVIEKYPDKICKIKGMTVKKAERISKEFNEIISIKNINESLQKYGISSEETIKIYNCLGSDAINEILKNPYILCSEGIDSDFNKADEIALNLDKQLDDPLRIKSGIVYVLKHNMNNGHTCLPLRKLVPVVSEFLDVDFQKISKSINDMIENEELIAENLNNDNFIFTPQSYNSESYCALRVAVIMKYPPKLVDNVEDKIFEAEVTDGIKYANLQRQAIMLAAAKGMLVLTGGPGTGKTTTLKAIIKILEDNGEKILLAAPTGRAAGRMSEITGHEAKTIHRMLEVCWDKTNRVIFNKNERNPLECDVLVIDEISMIDVALFEKVLRALPLGRRLILVGDSDQLPSIGAGNILGDLKASGIVPVVQLKEIFRQSQKSLIVINSHKIVNGEMPELSVKNNDFFFLPVHDPAKIQNMVIDLCQRRLPKSYGYSPIYDIQVITPGRKGILGTQQLNLLLQAAINPKSEEKREININGIVFREYDKVMQTKNNYSIYWEKPDGTCGEGIYNGDVGMVCEIDSATSYMAVKYDDKIAVYETESFNDLDLAYSMTVHKSQGSEFEAVVIPLYGKSSRLYYRNLLYTAVTRAKSKLILVGSKECIKQMVENDKKTKRYSALYEFLIKGNQNYNNNGGPEECT